MAIPYDRRLVVGNPAIRLMQNIGRDEQTWQTYVASLSPLWWGRFDEAAGALIDYGSAGVNGSLVGAITQGVAGQLTPPPEAYTFVDNTRIDIAYNAAWADTTVWEWVLLIKPTQPVHLGNNRFLGREVGYTLTRNAATTFLQGSVRNTASTIFSSTTSNQGIVFENYILASVSYNDLTDRLVRIFVNGVECTYSAQAALTETYQAPTSGMTIMNNQLSNADTAGDLDEAFLVGYNLSAGQHSTLKTLAGL